MLRMFWIIKWLMYFLLIKLYFNLIYLLSKQLKYFIRLKLC